MNNKLLTFSFIGLLSFGTIALQGMDNSHSDHSIAEINSSEKIDHEGHHTTPQNSISQAKLSVNKTIIPNKPVKLVINITDNNGKVISQFDNFQEKLMHLIIVSDDLKAFDHLHPNYQGKGRFEVEANFPKAGNYTIFSDYKPTGQTEQVSVLKTQVKGNPSSSEKIDLSTAKTVGNTKVNLVLPTSGLKTGQEAKLTFDLRQVANNQPISDLQPYLGEKGHLVILKQSSPLTRQDYIHAHPSKDTSGEKVEFMTSFPQPGKYKLWGQFKRNDQIVIADFWVNVL
jgi:hypothetical protein